MKNFSGDHSLCLSPKKNCCMGGTWEQSWVWSIMLDLHLVFNFQCPLLFAGSRSIGSPTPPPRLFEVDIDIWVLVCTIKCIFFCSTYVFLHRFLNFCVANCVETCFLCQLADSMILHGYIALVVLECLTTRERMC